MDSLDYNPAALPERPRTVSVIALIALAAGVFSYLWAYCLTDALVHVELIKPIARDPDPRPGWFITSFFALMIVFLLGGYLLQRVGNRDLRRLDEMETAD